MRSSTPTNYASTGWRHGQSDRVTSESSTNEPSALTDGTLTLHTFSKAMCFARYVTFPLLAPGRTDHVSIALPCRQLHNSRCITPRDVITTNTGTISQISFLLQHISTDPSGNLDTPLWCSHSHSHRPLNHPRRISHSVESAMADSHRV